MEIHDIIRRLREDKGLSQQNVADALGVDITTINRWENKGGIKNHNVEKLAKVLGVTVGDIYNYRENPSMLNEPLEYYKTRKQISVTIQLDGTSATLNEWFATLKKINSALT